MASIIQGGGRDSSGEPSSTLRSTSTNKSANNNNNNNNESDETKNVSVNASSSSTSPQKKQSVGGGLRPQSSISTSRQTSSQSFDLGNSKRGGGGSPSKSAIALTSANAIDNGADDKKYNIKDYRIRMDLLNTDSVTAKVRNAKPLVSVSVDVEIQKIDTNNSLMEFSGDIRFAMEAIHSKTQGILIILSDKTTTTLKELDYGWHLGVTLRDSSEFPLPCNPEHLVVNARDEKISSCSIFVDNIDSKKHCMIKFKVWFSIFVPFDHKDFPFDSNYAGFRVYVSRAYVTAYREGDIKALVPKSLDTATLSNPFSCKLVDHIKTYHLVAIFCDLTPPARTSFGHFYDFPQFFVLCQGDSTFHYVSFIAPMTLVMCTSILILLTNPITHFEDRVTMIITIFILFIGINTLFTDKAAKYMFIWMFLIGVNTFIMKVIPEPEVLVFTLADAEIRILDLVLGIVLIIFLTLLQLKYLVWKAPVAIGTMLCKRDVSHSIVKPWACEESRSKQLKNVIYSLSGNDSRSKLRATKDNAVDTNSVPGLFEHVIKNS